MLMNEVFLASRSDGLAIRITRRPGWKVEHSIKIFAGRVNVASGLPTESQDDHFEASTDWQWVDGVHHSSTPDRTVRQFVVTDHVGFVCQWLFQAD